jgi:phage minor structural protein
LIDENYRQKKWVSFHEYIGKDNYAGFKYGVNLKSIQRTIESEGIVSKLIVKNNSNEFATDGFCSIARATESPNGENFILDFSYYI